MANTLLVLGNGFDRRCGMKSSFGEYIDSDYYKERKQYCIDAVESIKKGIGSHMFSIDHRSYEKLTFWDLFFTLPFVLDLPAKTVSWSDFEQRLHDFIWDVQEYPERDSMIGTLSWKDGESLYKRIMGVSWTDIEERTKNKEQIYSFLLQSYLVRKNGGLDLTRKTKVKVDNIIYAELREFESLFGDYIHTLENSDYLSKAAVLVNQLVRGKKKDKHALTYVNTFNYSDLSSLLTPPCELWYVNGNRECPIFGIDLPMIEKTDDLGYKYTKTFRRLELDSENTELFPQNKDFTRIVVYGHALARQDYSYFFALFNRLGFTVDRARRNSYVVEFAYSAYDKRPKEEIKHETIERALRLLHSYNSEVLHEKNFRLMDILFTNGAIKFSEVSIAFT